MRLCVRVSRWAAVWYRQSGEGSLLPYTRKMLDLFNLQACPDKDLSKCQMGRCVATGWAQTSQQ